MSRISSTRLSLIIAHGSWLLAVAMAFSLGRMFPKHKTSLPGDNRVSRESILTDQRDALDFSRSDASVVTDKATESRSDAVAAQTLSGRQLKDLATEAVTGPSPLKRSLAMSKLLESLTAENALNVMAALKENDADDDEWELFRYAWAIADAEGAMSHALGLEGRARRDALEATVTGWASHAPDQAMAWVDALEDKEEQQRYRSSFVDGLADHNIGRATDYVMKLADAGDERAGRYLESVTREQLRSGSVQDSVRWSEALPDGKLKGQAMDSVAGRFVNEDPEAAAAWATQYAGVGYAARVIEEIGDEWAERDPSASVNWLQSLPEGEGQSEGMESAMGEWARRDPTAASEHLVTMPDSAMKDHAVSGFARRIVRENPEAAMAWAGTINQAEMRTETMTNAAREWFRRDREAASVWLESSGLSAEAQAAIVRGNRRG